MRRSMCLIVFAFWGVIAGSHDEPRLKSLSAELGSCLNELFNNATVDFINLYQICNGSNTYDGDRGSKLIETLIQFTSSLSNKFVTVEKSLQESVAVADDLYRQDNISGYCVDETCSNYPSPCEPDFDFEISYNVLYDQNVSFNSSSIHIPGDIYEHDPNVLQFLEWSRGFDEHFANQLHNLVHSFDVTYQYFGSRYGVLRVYPGVCFLSKLSDTLSECDRCPYPSNYTFDSRWRPWYTNTVSGPKFVAILLDMSGSMTGERINLARLTATQILKSLTANDFFLVIKVGGRNVTKPLDCFNNKTRASSENILMITEILLKDDSETVGHANFKQALIQALTALNDSCDCSKMIVVLTDKDVDNAQLSEVVGDQNQEQLDEVKHFIFLFGLGSNNGLHNIARDTGGKMYEVRDYSEIVNITRTFLDDLRRLLLTPESVGEVHWSHYRSGLGDVVLTGSRAFTRLSNDSEFVGVMGIDINVKSIQRLFLTFSVQNLCGVGYVFMTDDNGKLIVHPQVDYDYIKNNLSLDDFVSFDIRYFERAQNMTKLELLKNAMINREVGNITILTWIPVEKERRYLMRSLTHYYAPVENTPFSVAITLPSGHPTEWCLSNNFSIADEAMSHDSSSDYDILTNNRIFVRLFNGQLECFDESVTDCSSGGSTYACQYLNLNLADDNMNQILNLYADPHSIVAVKDLPASQHPASSRVPPGGVGVVIDKQNLTDIVSDTVMSHYETSDGTLYLLDSNGFIVWMSDDQYSQAYSQPFAKYQPEVFDDMIKKGIFIAGHFTKYGPRPCCTCGENITTCLDNAAYSIHKSFLLSFVKFISWLITEGLKTVILTSYYSVIKGLSSLSLLHMYTPTARCGTTNCPINLCFGETTGVELHPDFQNSTNQINCPSDENETTISYAIRKVEYTNLVIVETNGSCSTPNVDSDNQCFVPCTCADESY